MVNKMGSTQPDRSLSSSIHIPHWMNKVWDRSEMESFSPPSQDDGFYIRYPGMGPVEVKPKETAAMGMGAEQERVLMVAATKPAKQDFSLHTRPCQEFIPNAPLERKPAIVSTDLGKPRVKSQGTDDGFKGEGAACGKSVVEVAHQMIAEGKVIPRSTEDSAALSQGFDFSRRRNSKSLPATPLSTPSDSPDSSPRQNRRGIVQHNRYFSSTFVAKTEGDPVKFSSSWILSGLLGHQQVEPTPAVASDVAAQNSAELRRNKSLSSLAVLRSISEGMSDDESDNSDPQSKVVKAPVMRPNPSQFREMNFLSPTSM